MQFNDAYQFEILELFDSRVIFDNRRGSNDFDTDIFFGNAGLIGGLQFSSRNGPEPKATTLPVNGHRLRAKRSVSSQTVPQTP